MEGYDDTTSSESSAFVMQEVTQFPLAAGFSLGS